MTFVLFSVKKLQITSNIQELFAHELDLFWQIAAANYSRDTSSARQVSTNFSLYSGIDSSLARVQNRVCAPTVNVEALSTYDNTRPNKIHNSHVPTNLYFTISFYVIEASISHTIEIEINFHSFKILCIIRIAEF